ncbi:MAG TPA: GreA/GreB family elongation factor, partial [Fimbriimonadaceae bacterium]|nr:GreA/GreB family elongation factor [Fimbriimonadaceae bacterium]
IAKVVERDDSGGAHLGSNVTLLDLEFDDEFTVSLVGAFESDPTQDRISISSPLGESLVGKQPGEEVTVHSPNGVNSYRIIRVE